MPASNLGRFGPRAAALALTLLVAACGSGGGGGPDTRCFGVAGVPAWQIHVTTSFADTGTFDTVAVALHSTADGTTSTGSIKSSPASADLFTWVGGKPTGTFAAHDTVIVASGASRDTLVAAATTFGPGPSVRAAPYVTVDLGSCKATFGALLYSVATETQSGHAAVLDTLFAGYPFQPGITIDSLFVANGVTLSAAKVASVSIGAVLGTTGEYHVGGFSGPYVPPDTATYDSATVAWTVTPLAAPAAPAVRGAAAGADLSLTGALLPPHR